MSNTVSITTSDQQLWFALLQLKLDGVTHVPHLEHKESPRGTPVYKVVLRVASEVAIGLLCSWLYDQIGSHPEGETKIENQSVAHDRAQITTIIRKHVVINYYDCEKHPDRQRITDE